MMNWKRLAMATALASATALSIAPVANAGKAGIKVGMLECNVSGSVGFIFGSSKDMACTYSPDKGPKDTYYGTIDKYGVDLGYTSKSKIVWAVFAPSSDVHQGAIEGHYGGVSADVAAAYGLGANVLLGGFDKSITLQPLSVEGEKGVNLALGISGVTLKSVKTN